jgi:hypothetical protein
VSNNPPGIPRFNALTRAMDMVAQYNQDYTPRAFGGQGVPETAFVPKPQQQEAPVQQIPMQPPFPQAAPISQEEAQRRLAMWAAESGQVLDPNTGNVAARVPVAPMQAAYNTNPGVRRMPEYGMPQYQGPPPQQPIGHPGQYVFGGPGYGQPMPDRQTAREFMAAAAPPRMSLSPMSGIQSIQSIDFDRNVVWADGTPFPFEPREAHSVLQFALEVILRHFSIQFGALLQRYGLVQPVPGNVAPVHVPQGQNQATGNQELLQAVPRDPSANVPAPGAVPQQVPTADAGGPADGAGSGAQAS